MAAKRLSVCLVCACLMTACGELPEGGGNPDRHGGGGNLDLRPGSEPAASQGEALDAVASGLEASDGEGIPEFRRRALLEAARERGSRMGYARRGWEIGGLLERRSSQLDRAFDFSRVTSEAPAGAGYVIPPVVSRGIDAYEGDYRRRKVSVVDEYLTIASPGEIRPVRPTWRDYLLFEQAPTEDPGRAPLPRSQAERMRFAVWFGEGWRAGTGLADSEISSRLDRLRRDYEGMLRYRSLVSRGMMDRMVLRDADFGVTGGGGEMRVGDRTVRIVSDAAFRADPRRWSARALMERNMPAMGAYLNVSRVPEKPKPAGSDLPVFELMGLPASPDSDGQASSVSGAVPRAWVPHATGKPEMSAGDVHVSPAPAASVSYGSFAEVAAGGRQVSHASVAPVPAGSGAEVLRASDRPTNPTMSPQVSLESDAPLQAGSGAEVLQASDWQTYPTMSPQVSHASDTLFHAGHGAISAKAQEMAAYPDGGAQVSLASDAPFHAGHSARSSHEQEMAELGGGARVSLASDSPFHAGHGAISAHEQEMVALGGGAQVSLESYAPFHAGHGAISAHAQEMAALGGGARASLASDAPLHAGHGAISAHEQEMAALGGWAQVSLASDAPLHAGHGARSSHAQEMAAFPVGGARVSLATDAPFHAGHGARSSHAQEMAELGKGAQVSHASDAPFHAGQGARSAHDAGGTAIHAGGGDVSPESEAAVLSGLEAAVPRTGDPQASDRPAFASWGANVSPATNSRFSSGSDARMANAADRPKSPYGSMHASLAQVASHSIAGDMSGNLATMQPASPSLSDGSGS